MAGSTPIGSPESLPVPDFDPVPLRYRRDGWTPDRQAAFILELRRTRCVLEACRRVGRSSESAYRLSRHPAAAGFRRAWDEAIRGRAAAPSTSAPPSTSAAAAPARLPRAPQAAVASWPVPQAGFPPASWISSTSSTSSTSAAAGEDADGMCQACQHHQRPRGHQLPVAAPAAPPRRPLPAYSLEAFARVARRSIGRGDDR